MTNDYSTGPAVAGGGSPEPRIDDDANRVPGPPSTRSRLVWLVVAFICAALAARLGLWQLSRAHQKTSAAELIAERGAMAPLSAEALARDAASGPDQWQRRITLRGRWDGGHVVFLMNRTMDDRPGFFVMTPLRLPDGSAVVAQRGWIAGDPADPMRAPAIVTPAGEVRVEARVAPWPSRWFDFSHGADGKVRQNLERATFAAESGLALRPVMVVEQAAAGNAGDGLRRDWPAPDSNAVTNYGYAAQWFAMSAACLGLYVWVQFFRRRPLNGDAVAAADS
ncbi:MAG: SURF1 family protein [Burkholderiaceae bacterium]